MALQQSIDRQGLHLQSRSEPLNGEWWNWAVWLEGPPEVLDRVGSVRYALHPSFPDPVRAVTDRSTKFRLEAKGWGEFAIAATVTMNDATEITLERWLSLETRGGGTAEAAALPRPRVFLSYGGLDRPLVAPIVERLQREGLDVASSDTIPAAESVARSVGEALQKADILAVVTHGDLRGWAQEEVAYARDRGKPVVSILIGASEVPRALSDFKALHLNSKGDLDAVSDALAARARDAFDPEE
jgi:hypothetical protein